MPAPRCSLTSPLCPPTLAAFCKKHRDKTTSAPSAECLLTLTLSPFLCPEGLVGLLLPVEMVCETLPRVPLFLLHRPLLPNLPPQPVQLWLQAAEQHPGLCNYISAPVSAGSFSSEQVVTGNSCQRGEEVTLSLPWLHACCMINPCSVGFQQPHNPQGEHGSVRAGAAQHLRPRCVAPDPRVDRRRCFP